ncbi:MAG: hypothetical protein JNM09_30415 [Blastocatellia bacterium]|nr:hypothetical protein [Blastocatellia bacterium]
MQIKDRKCMAKGISVLLVLSIIFQPVFSAKATWIQESSKGDTETAWGLHTATFITRHGKIKATMPDDMAAGDTISGTVIAEPEGNTERDRAKNLDELNGFVVEMEKQKVPITEKVFKWGIPAALAGASAYLILRNKKGGEVARAKIPILNLPTDVERPSLPTSEDFHLPVIGQAGRPMQIEGPFDGNFSTTGIKINGRNAAVLAESPRKLVAQSPKDVVGPTNIQLKEKEVEIEGGFRNLSLRACN